MDSSTKKSVKIWTQILTATWPPVKQYFNGLILLLLTLILASSASPTLAAEINPTDSWNQSINQALEQQVIDIIQRHPEVILESVERYRQNQERAQRQQQANLLQSIKNNPRSYIQSSPAQGAIDPKLLIIEFSDFQCPYCARVHDTLADFMAKHADEVSLVYKHFPLYQIHSQAMAAARAAWAANRQGQFWPYHDALFDQQDRLSEEFYVEVAENLGLELKQFNRNRQSEGAIASIEQDMQLAEELGVGGTPFFVINGETISGAIKASFLEEKLANR